MATDLESVAKLSRDLKAAAVTLSATEARFLVDHYYAIQEYRKSSRNQLLALYKSGEPHEVLLWFADNSETLEAQIKRALMAYAEAHAISTWSMSITGIGPVIAAGLLAHIDITKAPTVGHIWRFAGLDPSRKWEKGEKRPWNASLKTLCWKIGQSFLKTMNHEDSYYGKFFKERWAVEKANNLSGAYSEQAKQKLLDYKIDKKKDAYQWYSGQFAPAVVRAFWAAGVELNIGTTRHIPNMAEIRLIASGSKLDQLKIQRYVEAMARAGWNDPKKYPVDEKEVPMLPPAHILQRSLRWTTKLFLSHWHEVAYWDKFGTAPPRIYVIEHLGHVDKIPVPNWQPPANKFD